MTQVAIQIPDELNQFLLESVRTGDYQNMDEFFVSMLYNLKEQSEAELTIEDGQKLTVLRNDISDAIKALEHGEGIPDLNYEAFLAERHRVYEATRQP
ncbi:hypothetical protein BH11VER1_BH11VER1_03810 [soil metagenome]